MTMDGSLIFAKFPALLARPPRAVAELASPTLLSKTLSLASLLGVMRYDNFDRSLPPIPAPRS